MSRSSSFEDVNGIDDGAEWELVHRDWWRTHYDAVSWSKSEARPECLLSRIRRRRPCIYREPHHFSDASLPTSALSMDAAGSDETGETSADLKLNPDLIGVKLAEDSLSIYEKVVGFDGGVDGSQFLKCSLEDLQPRRRPIASHGCDRNTLRERWRRETDPLFEGIPTSSSGFVAEVSEDEAHAILQRSTFPTLWNLELTPSPATPARSRTPNSMVSSIDFTDSDTSEPLPATPQITPSPSESRETSGSPSKRLNASATSFIPLSSSSSSLPSLPSRHYPHEDPLSPSWPSVASPAAMSISDFQFPSLPPPIVHSSSPPSRLQKDEQGFYTEVPIVTEKDIPRRQTSTPNLPTFLLSERRDSPGPNSRKVSKTREIVDQIKLGSVCAPPAHRLRRTKSKMAETDQDHDGWICADAQVETAPEDRAKRRKELVAVLGSREASKSKPAPTKTHERVPSTTKSKEAVVTKASRSRSPTGSSGSAPDASKPNLRKSEDGWIEAPASSPPVVPRARSKSNQRQQHTRNRSSVSVLSSVPSGPPTPVAYPTPIPHIAPPLYYSPVPAPVPVPTFAYPAAAYMPHPYVYPMAVQPVQYRPPYPPYQPALGPYGEAPLTSKVITGVTGMRHAAW